MHSNIEHLLLNSIINNFTPNNFDCSFLQSKLNEQLSSGLNQLVQSQLIQKILEEKLKNQILINTLLIKEKLAEAELQIQIQNNFQQQPKKNEFKIVEIKEEEQLSSRGLKKSNTVVTSKESIRMNKCSKKIKNQTKNIPKNFGKAIITYIQKNENMVKKVLMKFPNIQFEKFIISTIQKRKNINSIADLRNLWLDSENQFAGPLRILSLTFLRKHSLSYIFNSRVSNYKGHIKYRYRLIQALRNPQTFTCIKIY